MSDEISDDHIFRPGLFFGAYFEKTSEFGSDAKGMLADPVLIDGDPLTDIRNTRRISAVVANGRYLDHRALDAMLATVERLAQSGKHDLTHRPGRALK